MKTNVQDDDQRPTNTTTTSDRPVYESVKQAAGRLGISENAVRLRVKRGTLPAEKIGDQWFLVVGDRPATTSDNNQRPTTSSWLVGDQQLVVAQQFAAVLQPLVDRIGELEHDNGRLQAELAAAGDIAERQRTLATEQAALAAQIAERDQSIEQLQRKLDDAQRRIDDAAMIASLGSRLSTDDLDRIRALQPADIEALRSTQTTSPGADTQERPPRVRWKFWQS